MKLICKECDRILDEEEFGWWFLAIRVRKETCKKCEKRQETEWMIKELRKEEERKSQKKKSK